jgi:DNA-binding NtrC family response regulator
MEVWLNTLDKIQKNPIIVSKDRKMQKVYRRLKKIASSDSDVLLIGEDGTFKDVFAKAIHSLSHRKDKPFLIIKLSSLSVDLLEDYMFGDDMKRIKREANGGTIYFDDILFLDSKLQAKLYEFIINERSNGVNNINSMIDIRFIFSTDEKKADLFGSNQIDLKLEEIFIPPLRERKDDIISLAEYFMESITKRYEIEPKNLSKDAKEYIKKYNWPGNLRELEDTIKKAVLLTSSSIITKKDLILNEFEFLSIKEFFEKKLGGYLNRMVEIGKGELYETVMSEVEKALITIVLEATNYCQTKTARTLGINRNTLRTKIKEYKIMQ